MGPEVLVARVEELLRRVGTVEDELRTNRPVVLATQIKGLEDDVKTLADEVRGLRRAVIGFSITVAASAIAFALTVSLVWGGS